MDETQITWHEHSVTPKQHAELNGHSGCVVWFTGLSGSGKSTVANIVEQKLFARGVHTALLDGDNVRHGLTASKELLADFSEEFAQRFGLGFSAQDRQENIRRVGSAAALFASAGLVTLAAFVSPYRHDRQRVRQRLESQSSAFIEVFVDASLELCESRDPKGLYLQARAGEIKGMTGIDDPYEAPESPELHLYSGQSAAASLADQVVQYLEQQNHIQGV
ncbi:MAG: adenylyl-sulfate kinase [Planctomycetaceae bacterium]|jgi:adenylylsulfate kinase|nr:adenylyl-sulfate kinase [Planctomycetaceae bacterium]